MAETRSKASKKLCPLCKADLTDQYKDAEKHPVASIECKCGFKTDHWAKNPESFMGPAETAVDKRKKHVYGSRTRRHDSSSGDSVGADAN